jgi:hypothetical protein
MSRIAQIRAAAAGASASDVADEETPNTPDDGTAPPAKSKRKDDEMAEAEQNAAVETAKKEGHAAGFKAANERMAAVMASEHYAGREAAAAKMLSKEGMSADDIIDVLAASPKAETTATTPEANKEAAEEAARKEMKDAIQSGKNSDVDADAGDAPKEANHGWDAIHEEIRSARG